MVKQLVSAARYDDAQQVGALKQDLDRIAESLGGGPNVPLALRGIGTMIAMLTVGLLSGKADPRHLIQLGLILTSLSLWEITRFTTDTSGANFVRTGITQGLGLGSSSCRCRR